MPLMSSPFHSLALRRTAIKDAARREERWPAAILDTGGEFDVRRMFRSELPLINLDGAAQASLGAAPTGRGRQSGEFATSVILDRRSPQRPRVGRSGRRDGPSVEQRDGRLTLSRSVRAVSVSRWPPTELAPREGYFGQPAGSGLMSTIVWLVDIISFDGGTRGIELIS